jgi:hypothetical protein
VIFIFAASAKLGSENSKNLVCNDRRDKEAYHRRFLDCSQCQTVDKSDMLEGNISRSGEKTINSNDICDVYPQKRNFVEEGK